MAGGGDAIVARCHCGRVSLTLPAAPSEVTRCNCSLCRKTGFLGVYYPEAEVTVTGSLDPYVREDLDEACLTNWRCTRCGCLTHWTGLGRFAGGKMGVNARMLDAAVTEGLPVKDVDGASW